MKRLLLTLILLCGALRLDADKIKVGMIAYNTVNEPVGLQPGIVTWMANRSVWVDEGFISFISACAASPLACVWTGYVDESLFDQRGWYAIRNWYVAQGHGTAAQAESMNLHYKQNYTLTTNFVGVCLDQFDVWDAAAFGGENSYLQSRKGLMLFDGVSTYSDITVTGYNGNCRPGGGTPFQIQNTLYVGYMGPFDIMTIDIGTPAAGTRTFTWQYWNGTTWTALTVTDGTSGFTVDGDITMTPPSNWARTTVDSSESKFFVRLVVGGSGTLPTVNGMHGDGWRESTHAYLDYRGWDATDPGVINSGELLYNPTPPAGAKARFPYQARIISGVYAVNSFYGNPSNPHWDEWLVKASVDTVTNYGFDGMMFDNGTAIPQSNLSTPTSVNSDLTAGMTLIQYQIANLGSQDTLLKAIYGSSFQVSSNTATPAYAVTADGGAIENFTNTPGLGGIRYVFSGDPTADNTLGMDWFLTANNPGNKFGLLMFMDNAYGGIYISSSFWYPWDRSTRGPMATLAGFYIGSNPNTQIIYNSFGFSYVATDTYHYIDTSVFTTITTATVPSYSAGNVQIAVASTATLAGLATNAAIGCGGEPNFYIGEAPDGQGICLATVDGTHYVADTTNDTAIMTVWPIGTKIYPIIRAHQSVDSPLNTPIYSYGQWYPAMDVDIGTPTTARDIAWKLGSAITGLPGGICTPLCTNIWRREFTNAVVLARGYTNDYDHREFAVASVPICINDGDTYPACTGGPWYLLSADGTTGPAVTSFTLKSTEGAIYLTNPITEITPARVRGEVRMRGKTVIRP